MNDTATRTLVEERAHRNALATYRADRRRHSPFDVAYDQLNGSARYLAVDVIDGKDAEWAAQLYRTSRAIYEEVCRRAAIGGARLPDKTRTQQYWSTGRLAGAR